MNGVPVWETFLKPDFLGRGTKRFFVKHMLRIVKHKNVIPQSGRNQIAPVIELRSGKMFYSDFFRIQTGFLLFLFLIFSLLPVSIQADDKRLAYLVSDVRIPFWDIMWRGVAHAASK